ncbi:MAG: copper chaperone PCu(A)C [Maritimibacter sp.]|nr:copper chaperone PCu(A)C [Maritimibacter sp.]
MQLLFRTFLASLLLPVWFAAAAIAGPQDVIVENAWSRASTGTSRPGVAYLDIRNAGDEAVTLIGLRTDIAMMPEVHRTVTDANGVSSMSPAGEIEIAPGETVTLNPGGLHVMLMRLTRPMIEGESYALTLVFFDGGEKTIEVPILGFAARGPEG